MHEFEDLVEESVRVLDKSVLNGQMDLRTFFWRLYEFQACWDTGFTHFRVIDILLKHRFVYRFELNQHPDYSHYQHYFDNLKEFTFIKLVPDQPWHEKTNPAAGYYKPPFLYCDAGSPLWKRFVESGLLSGQDAVPPNKEISLIEVAKETVAEAERQCDAGDDGFIGFSEIWYYLLGAQLYSVLKDEELDQLKYNSDLIEFLRSIQRLQAKKPRNPKENTLHVFSAAIAAQPLAANVEDYIAALRAQRDFVD
jgi:hypothetical protein